MIDNHETTYREQFCPYCSKYRQITGRAWKTIFSKDGSKRKMCPICEDTRQEAKK
jgi:glutaredoxin